MTIETQTLVWYFITSYKKKDIKKTNVIRLRADPKITFFLRNR